MPTLAEFMIVVGADNRPPVLDNPQYESWKIRMELYIQDSRLIKNYPTKKSFKLIVISRLPTLFFKASNIGLQGLPPAVYTLVNHHKISKDIWDRVKLLMQGTSLSKQERECKLYDKFDKFSYVKAFHQNGGKFMTDVKLARGLHTSNYDQLYAYLEQYKYPQQFSPPIQHVYSPPPQSNPYGASHHSQQYPTTYPTNLSDTQPSVPQNAYPPLTIPQQPQAEFPQLDLGLVVPTFLPGDDPISCMNKAMAFSSVVFSLRYPSTNNQLRSSFNPRNQAIVQDGQAKVIKCYNYQGKGHMARQGNQPKKRKDASWFKEKVLLVQAQAEGKELDEEHLAFLADPRVEDDQVAQTITQYIFLNS
nr:hypothetical protein [Tanacetum cinerariifolium]